MTIYNEKQRAIAQKINPDTEKSNWKKVKGYHGSGRHFVLYEKCI